jgi:osmotically-inducible protein OsmY
MRAANGGPSEGRDLMQKQRSTPMDCRNMSRNLLTLLGGLGVGAAMVYLFDPDTGQKRRKLLARTAGDAWDNLKDKAGDYGATTGASLAALQSYIPQRKGRWGKSAQAYRRSLEKRAAALRDDASHRMDDLMYWGRNKFREGGKRLGYQYPEQKTGSFIGQTIAAVGFVALGVGLAYMMDPSVGRQRRAVVRDKVKSSVHQGQDYLSKTGRHLWNKAAGTVAEARSRLQGEQVADDVLVERVRSEIGRCVSSPGSILVRASSGKITLTGPIHASEVDGLLKCVWKTRGVKEIINELRPQEQMV